MAASRGVTLSSLSAETLREVLVRLPVDARARAAAVCRLWRDILADRSLWTRLDLSHASGVAFPRVTDAVLLGAAAKAGGGLTVLDASEGCYLLTRGALTQVVEANAGALTELHWHERFTETELEAVLRAAPLLRELHVEVNVAGVAVGQMLRNEPPFGPLRILSLAVQSPWPSNEATMRVFTAELSASKSPVQALCLMNPPPFEDGAFDALVDVALVRQLKSFQLYDLRSVISASSLARLLGSESLSIATISGSFRNETMLITELPSSATLITAARDTNSTLSYLDLSATGILSDAAAAEVLFHALLIAHPMLHNIDLGRNPVAVADRARIGALLGALVAANSQRLTWLNFVDCNLGDEGLGPLVDALKDNTTLRSLYCYGNDISEAFAHQRLRPAILANTGLDTMQLVPSYGAGAAPAYLRELEQLVKDRAERWWR